MMSVEKEESKTFAKWHKIGWVVAIEVALLTLAGSFFLPGGDDLHRFYLPFAGGCLDCGFVVYFAYWFLWPLALIPPYLAWPLWTAFSLGGILGLCWWLKTNPAIILLSFPMFGQIWLGQIDLIICLGLGLVLLAHNPYLRGLGVVLALIKPQITALALFFLLLDELKQNAPYTIVKVALLPALFFVGSLLFFGPAWPLAWLANAKQDLPIHVWRLAAKDISPYGIFLIWTPLLLKQRRGRFELALLVSALATPFFGVYSYIVFLLFRAPWWSVPLSYSWLLAYPIWGNEAMRLAWIVPAILAGYGYRYGKDDHIS
jgi:hypothetical protein